MNNRESQLNRLTEMKSFERNWNGYNGEPISNEAIKTAEMLVKLLNPTPFVSPTGRGTIQLEWENNNGYLELEIYENEISIYNQDKNKNIILDSQMDKFVNT